MAGNGAPAQAVTEALDKWHASKDSRQRYYIATFSDYLDRRDDGKRMPGQKQLPQDYPDSLCLLPIGKPYACRAPETQKPEQRTTSVQAPNLNN